MQIEQEEKRNDSFEIAQLNIREREKDKNTE